MITKMGLDSCPSCGYEIDSATALEGNHVPKANDLTICLKCAEYLYYESDMKLGVFPKVLFDNLDEATRLSMQKVRSYIRKDYLHKN